MSVDIINLSFNVGVFLFAVSALSFIAIFVLHVAMPKRLLDTYFKPPYFKAGEIAAFTGFPLGYIRTVMFMRVLAFPGSGKMRGLTEAYKLAPMWLCKAAKIILIVFVTSNIFLVALLMFLFFFA